MELPERLEERIDITDWMLDAASKEMFVKDEEDAIDLIANGVSTAETARAMLTSRALGIAPVDVLRPSKLLLQTGAMGDVAIMIRNQKVDVQTKDAVYELPMYIGRIGRMPEIDEDGPDMDEDTEVEDDGPSYIMRKTPMGLDRAQNDLDKRIPTSIFNCLLTVYMNNGSVTDAAKELKKRIDGMVKQVV